MGFYSRGGGPKRRPRRASSPSRPRPSYVEIAATPDASVVITEFLNNASKFGNNPRAEVIARLGGQITGDQASVHHRAAEEESAKCICAAIAVPLLTEIADSGRVADSDLNEDANDLLGRLAKHNDISSASISRAFAEEIYKLLMAASEYYARRGSDQIGRACSDAASALSNAYGNRPEQAARNAAWAVARFASLMTTRSPVTNTAVTLGVMNAMLAHKKPPSALPSSSPQAQEQAVESPLLKAIADAFQLPVSFPNTGNNPKLEVKRARAFLTNLIKQRREPENSEIGQQLRAMLVFFERPDAPAVFARPEILTRFATKAAMLCAAMEEDDPDFDEFARQELVGDLLIGLMGERL